MSIRAMTLVWASAPCKGGNLLILLAMADWAGDDGRRVFPTIETLAEKARLDPRQAQRCLRNLEKAKLIEPVVKAEGHRGRGTEYRVMLENLGQPPAKRHGWQNVRGDISNAEGRHPRQGRVTFSPPYIDEPSSKPLEPLRARARGADVVAALARWSGRSGEALFAHLGETKFRKLFLRANPVEIDGRLIIGFPTLYEADRVRTEFSQVSLEDVLDCPAAITPAAKSKKAA